MMPPLPGARLALISWRWLRHKSRGVQRRLRPSTLEQAEAWNARYQDIYRSIGERALESGRPGEPMPDLVICDIEGNERRVSEFWETQPALLITMSLSCGRTRQHACALRRLARRFRGKINTAIVYVIEAHPIDVASPYAGEVWVTSTNEIAGIHCRQPRTIEERIALANELRRRFHLSAPMLIDGLDDRAWRAFGCAPNVAILVGRDGRIAAKQGWFEPREMAEMITAHLDARSR